MRKVLFSLAALAAALAANAGATPAATTAWVRNYVATNATGTANWATVTNWVTKVLDAAGLGVTDEETLEVTPGYVTGYSKKVTDNGVTYTPRTFRVTADFASVSNVGARVVASSLASLPTGSVFTAFVKDGALVYRHYSDDSTYLDLAHGFRREEDGSVTATMTATNAAAKTPLQLQAGTNVWEDVVTHCASNVITSATTNVVVGTVTNAVTYSVTNVVRFAVTNDVTNVWTWVAFAQDEECTRYVRCTAFANGATNMDLAVGSFTLEPVRITESQWLEDAARYKVTESLSTLPVRACTQTNLTVWADHYAPTQLSAIYLHFDHTNATSGASVSSPSLWQALVPSARAQQLEKPDTQITVIVPTVPNVDMVDFPDPDEDHYYDPSRWYAQADWDNRSNWLTFPISIDTWYQDENDELWYKMVIKIKSLSQLDVILSGNGQTLTLPPTPYVAPVLKERDRTPKKCNHVWKKCVCTKCGETREHGEWTSATSVACSKCGRHDSRTYIDKNGNVQVEESDKTCGHNCDVAGLEYHGGWHDGGGEEYDTYSCGCECGYYGINAVKLQHTLLDYDPPVVAYKNETVHTVSRYCELCEAVRKYDESHYPDEESEKTYEQITTASGADMTYHIVHSACGGCGQELDIIEAHIPNYDNECLCPCGLKVHEMEDNACGFYKCKHCDWYDDTDNRNQHGHGFGVWYGSSEYHRCRCGMITDDPHVFKTRIEGTKTIRYCDVCDHVFDSQTEKPKKGMRRGLGSLTPDRRGMSAFVHFPDPDNPTNPPPIVVGPLTVLPAPPNNDPDADARCLSMLTGFATSTLYEQVINEAQDWWTKLGAIIIMKFTDMDQQIIVEAHSSYYNGQWHDYMFTRLVEIFPKGE